MSDHLESGRRAADRRAWSLARDELRAAHTEGAATADDLTRLALASFLTGDEHGFIEAMGDAYQAYLSSDDIRGAARSAIWVGLHLGNRKEMAQASGWFSRAGRLLETIEGDCAEKGYMLIPSGLAHLGAGRYEACAEVAREAVRLARECGDRELQTLALHMCGRALLREENIEDGLALLDEAMVSVVSDSLSPQVTGLVYCSVIAACRDVWAMARAEEWTRALHEWCRRQPDMVAYNGECRVYRAEVLRWRGAWHESLEEARLAATLLADERDTTIAGAAMYQQGEAYRLLGSLDEAENAFREASRLGRQPQPGLARLRLVQGDLHTAAASTRRALAETAEAFRRVRLLPAHIEVMLEVGDLDEARRAGNELGEIADAWGLPVLDAVAAQCRGRIALASDDAREAVGYLRFACTEWAKIGAPYEAACARLLLARCYRVLGDADGADLEREAGRSALEQLGAVMELKRLDDGTSTAPGEGPPVAHHGLTPREREVLAELATGRTNRAIAKALSISDKTVARHVANIFAKLGLSSRSAATAFAYEHDMARPRDGWPPA